MNAHKRKQVSSKKAMARAACGKKPGYEQEYSAAYPGHGSAMPSRPHYSESPARKGAAEQSQAQQRGHGGSDYGLEFVLEQEVGARAQRMLAGLHGLSKSKSKYLNTAATGPGIEKVNPYLSMCQSSQDVHQRWSDERGFNAYKRRAETKRPGQA